MRFKIKFISGITTVGEVKGIIDVIQEDFTMGEMKRLLESEKFIERITGLRVHIDVVMRNIIEMEK